MTEMVTRVPAEYRIRDLSRRVRLLQDEQWSEGFSPERSNQISELSGLLSAAKREIFLDDPTRRSEHVRR